MLRQGLVAYAVTLACFGFTYAQGGLTAQQSAEASAKAGRMAHRGGSYRYEGVGFSTRSAGDAIRQCCYHGLKRAVEVGVAKGANGWYACVRYR